MISRNLRDYTDLLDSFLSNRISSETFEREYLRMFKNDATRWAEEAYDVLNDLFGDVDAFCSNPELRGPDDLNDDQLRQSANVALQKLLALTRSL